MKPFRMSLSLSSLLVLMSYSIFTLLAYLNYPFAYSPLKNWLSDLGNQAVNPRGAIFYNIGIFLAATWLLVFFLGFSEVRNRKNRIQDFMVLLVQVFGVVGCISMALSAFFTIENPTTHSFFSAVLYICLGTAFAFSVAALRYDPRWPKRLLLLGILAALSDFLASTCFPLMPVFEWITVFLFLLYIAMVGIAIILRQTRREFSLHINKVGQQE